MMSATKYSMLNTLSTSELVPRLRWFVCPDRAKFGVAPRGAQAEIQNFASRDPWNIQAKFYRHLAVSECFENVDTVRMDGRTGGHLTGFTSHLGRCD